MDEVRYIPACPAAARPADISFMSEAEIAPARAFHQSVPEYRVTPLLRLDGLARDLRVAAVLIKDESARFGLGAFKGLGGIWVMARVLAQRLGVDPEVGFPRLRYLVAEQTGGRPTFITATAANHGRGVAWAARRFGCRSVVVIPEGADENVVGAIGAEGARVVETGSGFDEVVAEARRLATAHGWILLQDTAWEGYETVPRWILQGYGTMVAESLEEMAGVGLEAPTHVFLQVGVGSFAGAVTACLAAALPARLPRIYTAEPATAAALYTSVEARRLTRLDRCGPTAMACLACTEPSPQTWPVLRDWSAGHFACADSISELGQAVLRRPLGADPRVLSGPSGALGAGLLVALRRRRGVAAIRHRVGLGADSRVLVFSTEGELPAAPRSDPASL